MTSCKPILTGKTGAVSAAHPMGVSAGLKILAQGGNACDAMIAAQAALAVVMPASCGLGGDLLALVHNGDGTTMAINGTGKSPSNMSFASIGDDGRAVSVPGLVAGWCDANARFGTLSLGACLAPAIELARGGCVINGESRRAIQVQQDRLARGGASGWVVIAEGADGAPVRQPELATLLENIAAHGRDAYYRGTIADGIVAATAARGGLFSTDDITGHATVVAPPLSIAWRGGHIHVQPPITQGVLLAMCLQALERQDIGAAISLDHICVELTEASFQYRDRSDEGARLLNEPIEIDPQRASRRGGPRAYLHTAGVATADANGQVCSSLVSVFDHYGSCIYVPEGGFVLNNRAQGFTSAPNHPEPAKRPVHTLAPAMLERDGDVTAMATPGADGQIQTLLQVLAKVEHAGVDLAQAIHAPRWRSEGGALLIANTHPEREVLAKAGHELALREDVDLSFGGLVCAGTAKGQPFAGADWRREVSHDVI